MAKRYYKVVRIGNKKRGHTNHISAFNPPCGARTIQYSRGKWSEKPLGTIDGKFYGPLVFEDRKRAQRFVRDYALRGCHAIYACHVVGRRDGLPPYLSKPERWTPVWPPGTVMCESVKLLRRVHYG